MTKLVDVNQSHALMAVLAQNVDWEQLDAETIQAIIMAPRESGARFTAFLRNGGRLVFGGGNKLTIDRSKLFDPVAFIGKGWKIAEQDERALKLAEVDMTAVMLEHMLKEGEARVVGEEKLKRLKAAGRIRLDAGVFKALWDSPQFIPESWKGTAVFFDGTVLLSPYGSRCVLYLYWSDRQWDWDYAYLNLDWYGSDPSAVLASMSLDA